MSIETIKVIFLVLAVSFLIGSFHPCDICGGFWAAAERSPHPLFFGSLQIHVDGKDFHFCERCMVAALINAASQTRKVGSGAIR